MKDFACLRCWGSGQVVQTQFGEQPLSAAVNARVSPSLNPASIGCPDCGGNGLDTEGERARLVGIAIGADPLIDEGLDLDVLGVTCAACLDAGWYHLSAHKTVTACSCRKFWSARDALARHRRVCGCDARDDEHIEGLGGKR